MKLLEQLKADIQQVERDIVAFLKRIEESAALGAMTPIERRYTILGPDETGMTEAQIKHMVDRFLCWRLPSDFNPDGGVSFKKTFNDHMTPPMKNEPIGTNILDATQADAMVRYMVEGLPSD